jgi:hypothetical protein
MRLFVHRMVLATSAIVLFLEVVAVAQNDPVATAREFMRAIYSNDADAFAASTVPHPQSTKLLGQRRPTAEQIADVARKTSALKLEQTQSFTFRGEPAARRTDGSFPEGTITRYMTAYGGTPLVITMVRTSSGWKVDLRWWLAMIDVAQSPGLVRGSPAFAIKALLTTVALGRREDAKQFLIPGSDLDLVFRGTPRQPEPSDQLIELALEMPLVEIGPDEYYRLPSGAVVNGGGSDAERKVFVGLYGPHELVFVVRRLGEEWRVQPEAYYPLMNR